MPKPFPSLPTNFPTPPQRQQRVKESPAQKQTQVEETEESQGPTQGTAPSADKGGVDLVSPEGIAALAWAVVLDILGVILNLIPGLGLVTTVVGAITLLPWAWFRTGNVGITKKVQRYARRASVTAAAETLGIGILPGWTILVLLTLIKK